MPTLAETAACRGESEDKHRTEATGVPRGRNAPLVAAGNPAKLLAKNDKGNLVVSWNDS